MFKCCDNAFIALKDLGMAYKEFVLRLRGVTFYSEGEIVQSFFLPSVFFMSPPFICVCWCAGLWSVGSVGQSSG